MASEIAVALIGASASIASALIGVLPAMARKRRSGSPGHPVIVFFTILALGLAVTALFFAYTATGSGSPSEIQPGTVFHNTSRRAYFVIAQCNATGDRQKQVEVKIGGTPDPTDLIASESGGDRMSASAVVPAGSYYRVDASGATEGCNFRQWPL